mmetsp:Transcript_88417/g.254982  ORF Transcript_88417/g.254982 Transcript_88417/m.254982 type:complete len:402 (-) Transcript_88417:363-1568(-)
MSAPLFRRPQIAISARAPRSFAGKMAVPCSRLNTARPSLGPPGSGTTKSWTVISPFVRVPVLSEQNTDTQPSVSTASILRTRTIRFAICSEAIIREIVTVGSRPSGTCANKAAALFCKMSAGERFTGDIKLATRLRPPTAMATTAMMWMKCSIWYSKVDLTRDVLMPCAILPRKVRSPVACTRHVALPFSTVVPKNARFRASAGAQVMASVLVCRGSGMDSPVSAELSTSMPSVQYRTRTSAGTRSPASRKITSPGTRLTESMPRARRSPLAPRRTVGTGLSPPIFCMASMASSASISVYHCNAAVATMMTERRIGVTMSSFSSSTASFSVLLKPSMPGISFVSLSTSSTGSLKNMRSPTMAMTQNHSKMLKMPQKVMRSSLTHLFSFCGGVMRFGPYTSK